MIRLASLEDEQELRTLITLIDEDDYVLDHIHEWLRQESLFIYERDTIQGMMRLSYSRDHAAHLGSVRVHPAFRRQGIATALTEYCIDVCKTDVVRLAIMDSKISEAVARKTGFLPVATFSLLLKELDSPPFFSPSSARRGTGREAILHVENSPLFKQNHSLISSCFTFYTPSAEILEDVLILFCNDNMAILDFEIEEALRKAVQIAYLDPDSELVRNVIIEVVTCDMEEIWAVIPRNEELITCLKAHGFCHLEWGETITVFELHL
ncbi:MAG: GNAT family N-acetyltransferase [Theionarchaea archaeon]|nr:GNAT family N-acetyltransferase [Theionarchaea archaeon]